MLRLTALAFALLLTLAGCDANGPELADTNDFSLRLSGAIQSDFVGDAVQSEASARITTRPDGNQDLIVRLAAARRADAEEISQVSVLYVFDGEVAPGRYLVADLEGQRSAQAGITYQLDSSDLSARYAARGRDLVLEIVRVDADYISGRLHVRTSEVTGYRKLYGQTEEVTLAGRIDASAVFEAELAE